MQQVKIGDKARYVPAAGDPEKGIVKSLCDDPEYCFVIYNCAGEWDNYRDYTAARTNINDLVKGW